jgi:hypothetical protein
MRSKNSRPARELARPHLQQLDLASLLKITHSARMRIWPSSSFCPNTAAGVDPPSSPMWIGCPDRLHEFLGDVEASLNSG